MQCCSGAFTAGRIRNRIVKIMDYINEYKEIIHSLLDLDHTKNILKIDLQSDAVNYIEINVIFDAYDLISDDLWEYSYSCGIPNVHIDFFGKDQELPPVKTILYKRKQTL